MENNGITLAWWSGGITSAVACRLALEKYENVKLVYIETGAHHPDTLRFKKDCEKWYNKEIQTIQNTKYKNHFDVFRKHKFINSPYGAPCTKVLKRMMRLEYEKSNKIKAQVWGYEFTRREINRAIRTQEQYPETNPLFPLIEEKLNKNDCAGIIVQANIELPEMYKLGYNNNNCIGCVKGGKKYWSKIRRDFPDIYKEMSEIEIDLKSTCINGIYLTELSDSIQNDDKEVFPKCGLFCQVEFAHLMSNRVEKVLNGESIYSI
jgi:3'-phosphoadenosine 5'-phosphosulfate sulfotransferase (PAPS reductase)/FAD synthetase